MAETTSFNYVDTPNANLVCCICRMPFTDPWSTNTCGHTFCHECIECAIEHVPQCPVDRSALSLRDLIPANPIVRHLVDELLVECPQRPGGCNQTVQRQLLAAHIKNACQFVHVLCPEGDCDQMVLRKDVGKHANDCVNRLVKCEGCGSSIKHTDQEAHELECAARTITCKFCSAEFLRSDLGSHNASCLDYVIPCPQADNGCPWTGARSALSDSHISRCPYESIKGFFSLNSTRVAALKDENTILKAKVETLEGLVQTAKREMANVKFTLGPWYQPDGLHTPAAHPVSSSERPAPLRTRTRPTSFDLSAVTPPPASIMAFTSPNGAMNPASPNALAAYFPPEAGEPSSWAGQRRGSMSFIGDPSGRLYQESPIQASVAPLNLSTTLEGSLSGLRDSVITLSAAVDSLARRTDMERRNEGLRMNEEVSRLNYTVHGLRMQVHNVMMDRNAQVMGRTPESWQDGENGLPPPNAFFSPRSASFSAATKL